MEINVKLMGMLAAQTPADGKLQLSDGGTIEDALVALGIPVDSVADKSQTPTYKSVVITLAPSSG